MADFFLSDNSLAQINPNGRISALSVGTVQLRVDFKKFSKSIKLKIKDFDQNHSINFPLELGGIFTRKGCNSSECHGSVKGRGGFKLSTNANNPLEDHRWLVKGGKFQVYSEKSSGPENPRINLENPEESLILQKPTLQIAHGGGEQFDRASLEYQTILRWISNGALYDNQEAVINKLKVFPEVLILERNRSFQLIVTAHLSNGEKRDFTRKVHYESNSEEVVSVDPNGLLTARKPGETSIIVRAPKHAVSIFTGVKNDFINEYPPEDPKNFIDKEIVRKIQQLSIPISAISSDHEFLRRICLDLTGTLPPPNRVREFLKNSDPNKRDQLINILINSHEFIDYWTFRLADLFRVSYEQGGRSKVKLYWEWIRECIAQNKPFDQIALERIASQGYNGPTRHFWGSDEIRLPQDIMAEQAQVFLGRRLVCAQCHDHPFDSWTQDQFWGMTGFFKNLTYFWNSAAAVDDSIGHQEFGTESQLLHPRTKREVEPIFPDGRSLLPENRLDPRPKLAHWFTSSKEYLFEEAIVNRFWSYFFGRGFVNPVDDFRVDNPPSHRVLLKKLASHFRLTGYDLKSLMLLIVQSNTYQRSGQRNKSNGHDRINYSRALPRGLDAEILLDMISQISGISEVFEGKDERLYAGQLPPGTRAINIIAPHIYPSHFLDIYGRSSRLTVPDRKQESSVSQALAMLADPTYTKKLSAKGGRIDKLLRSYASDEFIIENFYLSALSRFPTPNEKNILTRMIKSHASRREALEDLLWSIISSREFAYNH